MEFWLLGPLQVSDGDRPVEIAGSKRRAVLAMLLLRANEVVRSERLVEELWGEQPPRNAQHWSRDCPDTLVCDTVGGPWVRLEVASSSWRCSLERDQWRAALTTDREPLLRL